MPKPKDNPMPTGKQAHKKRNKTLKLNEKMIEEMAQLLRVGNYVETACWKLKIHKTTFYAWLRKGDEDIEAGNDATLEAKLSYAVSQGMADFENDSLKLLEKAARKDWRAVAWRLERKVPRKWGPKSALKIEGDKEGFSDEENIHATLADIVAEHEKE